MYQKTYFTLSFLIRRSQQMRSGEVPVFARISMAGQRTEFNIGRSVMPGNWNTAKGQSKGHTRKDVELNKFLDSIRVRLSEIHAQLLNEEELINPQVLKDHYLGKIAGPRMLVETFNEVVAQYKEKLDMQDISLCTFLRWERCGKYLSEFLYKREGTPDIPIKKLTGGMVDDFEHFLRVTKENGNNAAVKYIRYLKKVTRIAIANKWMDEDPFINKRYTRTQAKREALNEEEIKRIMSLNLGEFASLERVRDTFIFCCFTGLAFVDVSTLTAEQVVTDSNGERWIKKPRQKTGEVSSIPLLGIPVRILEKYKDHPAAVGKGRLLPVISCQRMNSYLAEIATLARVKKHLTTHIARHTFATISLRNHVPIESISKMLGHSDIQTTQIYAKMLDEAVSEDMQRMRSKFDAMQDKVTPIAKTDTFDRPPIPKRGRPRKCQQ